MHRRGYGLSQRHGERGWLGGCSPNLEDLVHVLFVDGVVVEILHFVLHAHEGGDFVEPGLGRVGLVELSSQRLQPVPEHLEERGGTMAGERHGTMQGGKDASIGAESAPPLRARSESPARAASPPFS